MAERTNTGNVMLDAWINAFSAFAPDKPADAGGSDKPSSSPFAGWERLFFGGQATASGSGTGAAQTRTIPNPMETWSELAQRSIGVITALGASAKAGDPLGEALERTFGVVGDVGAAAGEVPALLAEIAHASSVLYAARERYAAFMLATWQRAFEEVSREALRKSSDGQTVLTPARWSTLANAVADRVFVEAFHSQAYLDAQHALSSALADVRRAETKLIEFFAQHGHFPTREAFDAVTAEVTELRRRVRQLERSSRTASLKRRAKAKAADDR